MKIDRVEIKNFKSLKDVDIELTNLTLISGVNSTGKSSFIQALLLLVQNKNSINNLTHFEMMKSLGKGDDTLLKTLTTMYENSSLVLDGKYVELGNKKDILYQEVFDEDIIINVYSKDKYLKTNYNKNLKINIDISNPIDYLTFNLFLNNFQYIKTDRVSPAITYKLSEIDIKENLIGLNGEYTAHFLAENNNKNIFIEALVHPSPNRKTKQLLENTSLWLSEISRGIDIDSTINPSQNNVTLTYSYVYGNNKTNKFNPLNVGFGITYVLPIIVSILKSKPNDLIIIENPESHLHPAGQSKMAELCAIASANGVQIIIETHSDHFLNGIRVATKKHILKPEDTSIYYFRKNIDELETKIDTINLDEYGNIDNYPKGFFDEWDNKLDELLGL